MAHYPCCGDYDFLQVSRGASNVIDSAQASTKALGHHVDLLLEVGGYPILVDLVYKGKPPIIIDENSLQEKKAALLELDCDSFSISALKSDRNLRFSDAVLAFLLKTGERDWRFHPKTVAVLKKAKRDHRCARPESSRYVAPRCQWPFILTHLWPIKLTHLS